MNKLQLRRGLTGGVASGNGRNYVVPTGWRSVMENPGPFANISLRSGPPTEVQVDRNFVWLVSNSRERDAELYRLVDEGNAASYVAFLTADVHPQTKVSAEHQMRMFARRILGEMLAEAVQQARDSLVRHGYDPDASEEAGT